tara:strand:- start:8716 stop:9330 length:615 start_codon:yes stop_codon:yes gene_type:complete
MAIDKNFLRRAIVTLFIFIFFFYSYCVVSLECLEPCSEDLIKSQAAGPIINSESNSYQLITNSSVFSIVNMDSHQHQEEEESDLDNDESWSMDYGSFHLSINNEASEALSNNVLSNYRLAINLDRGNVVIVTGEIIVKFSEKIEAEEVANDYNIILKSHYEYNNTAFFIVSDHSKIAPVLQLMKQDQRIHSAYMDVIESINIPN